VQIDSAWKMIRVNTEISAKESFGYYKLKKGKPLFISSCSELLDQGEQAKLQ
jgi:hypothetical protein